MAPPLCIQFTNAAEVLKNKFLKLDPEGFESKFVFPAIDPQNADFSSTGVSTHDQFASTLDGDPVLRTFNNFTINEGHLVTTTNRCKGLYLKIRGNLVVNGTLSMTARGAKTAGKYVAISHLTNNIYYFENDPGTLPQYTVISKIGGIGLSAGDILTRLSSPGSPGIHGACASGGNSYFKGGDGTSFSGGAGAGGLAANNSGSGNYTDPSGATPGAENGGAGGNGARTSVNACGGGGAGNPGGFGQRNNSGTDGTGGLLILFVDGDITFGPSGYIQSHGSKGGSGHPTLGGFYPYSSPGAGSGAGAIHLFHRQNISDPSKVVAIGGEDGGINYGALKGEGTCPGGNGTVNIIKLQ